MEHLQEQVNGFWPIPGIVLQGSSFVGDQLIKTGITSTQWDMQRCNIWIVL